MLGLKKIGEAHGEFNMFEPLKLNEPEERGDLSYGGKPLAYIPVSGMPKGMAAAGLDDKLKRLIQSCWIRAKPQDGALRGSAIAGSHRIAPPTGGPAPGVARPVSMPPLPLTPGQRGVRGMVEQYRAVQPVGFSAAMAIPGSNVKLQHLMSEVPKDFALMQSLPVVSAYAFRGDSRNPQQIRQANGFQPPISRTDDGYLYGTVLTTFNAYLKAKIGETLTKEEFSDLLKKAMPDPQDRLIFSYYEMWRGQVAAESMHVGRMVANETLKGYVSTSRAPTVAKGFAKPGGYVYFLRVRTGFLIPPKGSHPWTHIFGEEEIASPKAIDWEDVIGFRAVGQGKLFNGPICMRKGLNSMDANGFEMGIRALSGKHKI